MTRVVSTLNRFGWSSLGLGLVLTTGLGACTQPKAEKKADIDAATSRFVLPAVPADVENRVGALFENRVELVGYEIQRGQPARPGTMISVNLYWRCLAPVEPGFTPYAELVNGRGVPLVDADGKPMKGRSLLAHALPPSKWEPGKVYVDTVLLRVPRFLTSDYVTLTAGIEKLRVMPDAPAPEGSAKAPAKEGDAAALEKTVATRLTVSGGSAEANGGAIIAALPTRLTDEQKEQIREGAKRFAERKADGKKPATKRRPGQRPPPRGQPPKPPGHP